jgi:hypothetical protein
MDPETSRQLRMLALSVEDIQKRLSNISREIRDWEFDGDVKAQGNFYPPSKTDVSRGDAGKAGRVIYNTDSGQLNIDDGTNWTLPDGTTA